LVHWLVSRTSKFTMGAVGLAAAEFAATAPEACAAASLRTELGVVNAIPGDHHLATVFGKAQYPR
jgi:hypothetical protein